MGQVRITDRKTRENESASRDGEISQGKRHFASIVGYGPDVFISQLKKYKDCNKIDVKQRIWSVFNMQLELVQNGQWNDTCYIPNTTRLVKGHVKTIKTALADQIARPNQFGQIVPDGYFICGATKELEKICDAEFTNSRITEGKLGEDSRDVYCDREDLHRLWLACLASTDARINHSLWVAQATALHVALHMRGMTMAEAICGKLRLSLCEEVLWKLTTMRSIICLSLKSDSKTRKSGEAEVFYDITPNKNNLECHFFWTGLRDAFLTVGPTQRPLPCLSDWLDFEVDTKGVITTATGYFAPVVPHPDNPCRRMKRDEYTNNRIIQDICAASGWVGPKWSLKDLRNFGVNSMSLKRISERGVKSASGHAPQDRAEKSYHLRMIETTLAMAGYNGLQTLEEQAPGCKLVSIYSDFEKDKFTRHEEGVEMVNILLRSGDRDDFFQNEKEAAPIEMQGDTPETKERRKMVRLFYARKRFDLLTAIVRLTERPRDKNGIIIKDHPPIHCVIHASLLAIFKPVMESKYWAGLCFLMQKEEDKEIESLNAALLDETSSFILKKNAQLANAVAASSQRSAMEAARYAAREAVSALGNVSSTLPTWSQSNVGPDYAALSSTNGVVANVLSDIVCAVQDIHSVYPVFHNRYFFVAKGFHLSIAIDMEEDHALRRTDAGASVIENQSEDWVLPPLPTDIDDVSLNLYKSPKKRCLNEQPKTPPRRLLLPPPQPPQSPQPQPLRQPTTPRPRRYCSRKEIELKVMTTVQSVVSAFMRLLRPHEIGTSLRRCNWAEDAAAAELSALGKVASKEELEKQTAGWKRDLKNIYSILFLVGAKARPQLTSEPTTFLSLKAATSEVQAQFVEAGKWEDLIESFADLKNTPSWAERETEIRAWLLSDTVYEEWAAGKDATAKGIAMAASPSRAHVPGEDDFSIKRFDTVKRLCIAFCESGAQLERDDASWRLDSKRMGDAARRKFKRQFQKLYLVLASVAMQANYEYAGVDKAIEKCDAELARRRGSGRYQSEWQTYLDTISYDEVNTPNRTRAFVLHPDFSKAVFSTTLQVQPFIPDSPSLSIVPSASSPTPPPPATKHSFGFSIFSSGPLSHLSYCRLSLSVDGPVPYIRDVTCGIVRRHEEDGEAGDSFTLFKSKLFRTLSPLMLNASSPVQACIKDPETPTTPRTELVAAGEMKAVLSLVLSELGADSVAHVQTSTWKKGVGVRPASSDDYKIQNQRPVADRVKELVNLNLSLDEGGAGSSSSCTLLPYPTFESIGLAIFAASRSASVSAHLLQPVIPPSFSLTM